MVNLNYTIIIQMIGFLILLFILNLILYRPVLAVLRKRRESLEALHKEAEELKKKATHNEEMYNTKLQQAEENAKAEYQRIVDEATKQKESRLEEERRKAKEILDEHKKQIDAMLESESKEAERFGDRLSEEIFNRLVA